MDNIYNIFTLLSLTCLVLALGEDSITIVHTPAAITFSPSPSLPGNELTKVLSKTLGFTPNTPLQWKGVTVRNPFGYANGLLVVEVIGDEKLQLEGINYPIKGKVNLDTVKDDLISLVEERSGEKAVIINDDDVDLYVMQNSGDSIEVMDIPYEHLNSSLDTDNLFLQKANLLSHIPDKLPDGEAAGSKMLIWVQTAMLPSLDSSYSADSAQGVEARNILTNLITKLSNSMQHNYKQVVVAVIYTSAATHNRVARSVSEGGETKNQTKIGNLTGSYTSMYPIMFNIFLWFGIAFALAVIVISYGIGNMDPGRDSIIYRMTSTKLKKDQ